MTNPSDWTLDLDHRDLALRYAQQELSALSYALAVLNRMYHTYPFLTGLPMTSALRLIPGLPTAVQSGLDDALLVADTAAFLGLTHERPPYREDVLTKHLYVESDAFFPAHPDVNEVIVLVPHHDRAHPGQRVCGWLAPPEEFTTILVGPWFCATTMAALAVGVDHLHQLILSKPSSQEM
ncbi:MAG: hypothetical protein EI684_21435 [Candidatus Viridilinea halotolerans]|uniref:Uncharacterized protein n=1 Tax=Candidatus Viridilinea halotolerans TaxID=2491704 RepID=A0A426TRF4_9CHLR|nr:MAG: hypothetical protein EI684_21435 [Candidatus Viridilinea halotolerans]